MPIDKNDLVLADALSIEEIERLAKEGSEVVIADGHTYIKVR